MGQAVKVGIFMTVALAVAAYLILRIEDFNPFAEGQRRVDAEFRSVAGLDDKASVRVAGVRVGRVDGIGLEGRQARVTLLLEQPLELTEGTRARIANMGLLGDKYVELVLGPAGAPLLPDGAVIPGETPVSFDDAIAKLDSIGDSIQQVTGSLTGGEGQETPISRMIANLEATSSEIRELVAINRDQVSATVANFESFSATLARELPLLARQLEGLVQRVDRVVDDNRDELAGSLENIEEVSAGLKVSVANVNDITGKLASGEGTLGKLIYSDEAHTSLVSTLDSIEGGVATLSDTLGRAAKLKLDLGLQGYYLFDRSESESAFNLEIDPAATGSRKLYRVGLVNNLAGDELSKTQQVTVTNPDGTVETTTIETFTTEDKAVLSALLGLRLDNGARLWGGLIEEEFGVEVNYPFFDRRLWIDAQAFDFDRRADRNPHLRLSGRYFLNPNIFVVGGYDDPLESDFDSFFLGGGLTWTDENLKYLLGSIPAGAF